MVPENQEKKWRADENRRVAKVGREKKTQKTKQPSRRFHDLGKGKKDDDDRVGGEKAAWRIGGAENSHGYKKHPGGEGKAGEKNHPAYAPPCMRASAPSFLTKGIPSSSSKNLLISGVEFSKTMLIFIPWVKFTLAMLISGHTACSVSPIE